MPVGSISELIAYAKARPDKISLASYGTGTISHLAGELFKSMTGTEMVHVPYRGSSPMLPDLLGGQVHAAFVIFRPPSSISGPPDYALWLLPPYCARKHAGFACSGRGIVRLRGKCMDRCRRAKEHIRRDHRKAQLRDQCWPTRFRNQARLADLGAVTFSGSPADLGKFIVEETEKWGKIIRAASIKAE